MYKLLYALALASTPALAQTPPNVAPAPEAAVSRTYSQDSMDRAVADFRRAWQQNTGNPYYGPDSAIAAQFATQVAARAYEARKSSAPVSAPDAAALAAERARALSDARAALAGVR